MPSILFKECIDILGNHASILTKEESDQIAEKFEANVPLYRGGSKIDWDEIDKKKVVDSLEQVIPSLEKLLQKPVNTSIYILWNDASLPGLKTTLDTAIVHFNSITRVGFETWFYNPDEKYIIEFCNSGELSIGLLPH